MLRPMEGSAPLHQVHTTFVHSTTIITFAGGRGGGRKFVRWPGAPPPAAPPMLYSTRVATNQMLRSEPSVVDKNQPHSSTRSIRVSARGIPHVCCAPRLQHLRNAAVVVCFVVDQEDVGDEYVAFVLLDGAIVVVVSYRAGGVKFPLRCSKGA